MGRQVATVMLKIFEEGRGLTVWMMNRRSILAALALTAATTQVAAKDADKNHVSKVFRDGEYTPHVYLESDIVRRYGEGEGVVDDAGLMRRRYWDPSTKLEVVITSNPDIGPKYRTIDEIRVSPIFTGKEALGTTESLKGLSLQGIVIGDTALGAERVTRRYGQAFRSAERLGQSDVERFCGYRDGSSICFDVSGGTVIAMAVGAGP